MSLQPHPISQIFPMMSDNDYQKLKADIEKNGIQSCGLLYEGKILDGRNRHRACGELGIELPWQEVELDEEAEKFDPISYVLTHNLHRRHLKQSQRAMIAAKMATLKHGGDRSKSSNDDLKRDESSALLGVSTASIDRAKHILQHGSKELLNAVEQCEVTVSMAEKLCKACADKREQTRLVKEGKKAIKEYLEPEATEEVRSDDGDDDGYDYPVVMAFKHADYRLETLLKILEQLNAKEKKAAIKALSSS